MGHTHFLYTFSLVFLSIQTYTTIASTSQSSTYIVHTAAHSSLFSPISAIALAKGVHPDELDIDQDGPLYAYSIAFNGFVAKLTQEEAQSMKRMEGVVNVVEDMVVANLHTTHTPEFLELNPSYGIWPVSHFGEDVIIGVIDTGIWPESKSFNPDDRFLGPIPRRWRGICESTPDFSPSLHCNKKIVGARAFYKGYEAGRGAMNETLEYKSPRDGRGHGTHTASTAAGGYVPTPGLFGLAGGAARGMATRARLAIYKACWSPGCFNSDLLAAFDQAISDGVDLISLSVGSGGEALPYYLDPIAIGSFAAVENGILVSASAGNSGPVPGSVANVAPWLLTVGASTLDRDFPAFVKLANNESYRGISLHIANELSVPMPLIYGGDAGLPGYGANARLCMPRTLDPRQVKGKIVVCDRGVNARAAKGMAVQTAGGVGMILANAKINGEELIADSHVLPALLVGFQAGGGIKSYIARSEDPMATVYFAGTAIGIKPAPMMAAFSSRGPNPANPEILKPDISAPGVNILAAWTSKVGPTELPEDPRVVDFNIMSGTSMACPHVTGIAALIREVHPNWSPAAIKSALMTTANTRDNIGNAILDGFDTTTMSTPFVHGAGHVHPMNAVDPGLVYDLSAQDYVDFLCGLNYTQTMLSSFTKGKYNCSSSIVSPGNLNYPSLTFIYNQGANADSSSNYSYTLTRVVTNVGPSPEVVYTLKYEPPEGVIMMVEPTLLAFKRLYERKSYVVTCQANYQEALRPGESSSTFGSITWRDTAHDVSSYVAFTWQN